MLASPLCSTASIPLSSAYFSDKTVCKEKSSQMRNMPTGFSHLWRLPFHNASDFWLHITFQSSQFLSECYYIFNQIFFFQYIWKCLNFSSYSLPVDLFTSCADGKIHANLMTPIQSNSSSLSKSSLEEFISFDQEGYL